MLTDRRKVDVVLERDVDPELLARLAAEGAAFEARMLASGAARRVRVDDAGHAEHDPVDSLDGEGRRRDQRFAQRFDRVQRASASAPRSSTSWRARILAGESQTAPRRNRAPRSSPSTNAASGTGSKNTAP